MVVEWYFKDYINNTTKYLLVFHTIITLLFVYRAYSWDERPYWFTLTKDDFWIKIDFNSRWGGLVHQYGRRFFVLEHQYGCRDVMWIRSISYLRFIIRQLVAAVFYLETVILPRGDILLFFQNNSILHQSQFWNFTAFVTISLTQWKKNYSLFFPS